MKSHTDRGKTEIHVARIALISAVVVALIGVIGAVLNAYLTSQANQAAIRIPIQATQTAEARLTLVAVTATSTPSPTSTLTLTPTPTPTLAPIPASTHTRTAATASSEGGSYDFEGSTENWNTSEGSYKLATLDNATAPVYSGNHSLRLTTVVSATGDDVYRHTEATAYFNNAIPQGINKTGPYDLTGKRVSCLVYLPSKLVSAGRPQAYIRIFVKDDKFRNQSGRATDIVASNAERWLELTLTVGVGEGKDAGFDSARTNALGIRIELQNGSTLTYAGPIYIDHCSIQYP